MLAAILFMASFFPDLKSQANRNALLGTFLTLSCLYCQSDVLVMTARFGDCQEQAVVSSKKTGHNLTQINLPWIVLLPLNLQFRTGKRGFH